jgi:hypothetical protein
MISVMSSLPHEAESFQVYVLAADAGGRAVIEVAGETFWFNPGTSWVQMGKYEPQIGCRVVRET